MYHWQDSTFVVEEVCVRDFISEDRFGCNWLRAGCNNLGEWAGIVTVPDP
jgi:hypothetical protein